MHYQYKLYLQIKSSVGKLFVLLEKFSFKTQSETTENCSGLKLPDRKSVSNFYCRRVVKLTIFESLIFQVHVSLSLRGSSSIKTIQSGRIKIDLNFTAANLQIRLVLISLTKGQRWNDKTVSQTKTDLHFITKFDKRAKINPAIGDMFSEESKLISRDNFQTLPNHNLILHQ